MGFLKSDVFGVFVVCAFICCVTSCNAYFKGYTQGKNSQYVHTPNSSLHFRQLPGTKWTSDDWNRHISERLGELDKKLYELLKMHDELLKKCEDESNKSEDTPVVSE